MQLIKTEKRNGIDTVNARDLHEKLEVKKDFSDWIRDQLKYFEKEQDYTQVKIERMKTPNGGKIAGRQEIAYFVTIDTAKHICMMSKTSKGKELRQYFIDVEKAYFKETGFTNKSLIEKSTQHRNGLTSQWKDHGAIQYGKLTQEEYKSVFNNKDIRKAKMSEKELVILSAFELFESMKLNNNPQIEGDNQLINSMYFTADSIKNIIKKQVVNDKIE